MLSRVSRVALLTLIVTCAVAAAKAPDFTLPTGEGPQLSLVSMRGHRVVISFYASYF